MECRAAGIHERISCFAANYRYSVQSILDRVFPFRAFTPLFSYLDILFLLSVFICVNPWSIHTPNFAKRLPGFTATSPLRQRGHSEAS